MEMETKSKRSFFYIPTHNGTEIMERLYEECGSEYDKEIIPYN